MGLGPSSVLSPRPSFVRAKTVFVNCVGAELPPLLKLRRTRRSLGEGGCLGPRRRHNAAPSWAHRRRARDLWRSARSSRGKTTPPALFVAARVDWGSVKAGARNTDGLGQIAGIRESITIDAVGSLRRRFA